MYSDVVPVPIAEQTDYPFANEMDFTIQCPQPVAFPLTLRIPGWCDATTIVVNGKPHQTDALPGSYVVLDRIWKSGDHVHLELPMRITLSVWENTGRSVSVNRGPLSYSFKIGEKWTRYGGTDRWPAYEVFPTPPWNPHYDGP